jgi:hypothetical protein
MKKILLGAAMVAAMAIGGGTVAHAAVYDLTVVGCTTCTLTSYGTVTTTGEGTTSVDISVQLATDVWFNQAGGAGAHDSFAWSLTGTPTVTLSGITPTVFGTNGAQSVGTHHEDGLGFFEYIVDYIGPPNDNSTLCCQTLNFTITSLSALTFTSNDIGGQDVFFSVDVAQVLPDGQRATGVIGAVCPNGDCGHVGGGGGPVPEPATWAMMIMGFGGMGAILRHNRRRARMAFA